MKRARWMVVGAVLVASCGWIVSSGIAQQRGGKLAVEQPKGKLAATTAAAATPIVPRSPGAAERKILAALEEPVNFTFQEMPLPDVIAYVKDRYGLQIHFNSQVLTDAGKDPSTILITSDLNGISLRSGLRLILAGNELAYYIGDEVLQIATKEHADVMFETRLYDVRDLTTDDLQPAGPPNFEPLIKTIVTTVPGDWCECNKQAAVCEFSSGGVRAIAVNQTFDGHARIEALLAELRRLKPQR